MGFTGSSVNNPNRRLHMLIIVFFGIMAFGAVLYWREQSMVAAEYVDFPSHQTKKLQTSEMRSKKYQLQTEEVSPSVK